MSSQAKLAIVGASGMGGRESLRLLKAHPYFEVAQLYAGRAAGKSLDEVHPSLSGFYDLSMQSFDPEAIVECDGALLALPHQESAKAVKALLALKPDFPICDLSGALRLNDPEIAQKHYGADSQDELLSQFKLGLPECNRDALKSHKHIAAAGCFATCSILSLVPAVKGLKVDSVIVDAKTGSSGSGLEPKAGTHHPIRSRSFYAYALDGHRHQAEIEQAVGDHDFSISFLPQSAPFVRGIFCSVWIQCDQPEQAVQNVKAFAAAEKLVRWRDQSPNVEHVEMTPFFDVHARVMGPHQVLVLGALDNLMKGMVSQAIQCLNLSFGRPEFESLI